MSDENPTPNEGSAEQSSAAEMGHRGSECPTEESNAAKLRARLDRLEDMYFRPGAYETKIAQWEVKELRTHRPHLWKDDEPIENDKLEVKNSGDNTSELVVPSYASSQAELAKILDTYFRARISIEITPTLVGLWRKGVRVGEVFIDGRKVIPPSLPKNKSGNRFETQPCIDWVEKWIVPQKRVDAGGQRTEAGGPGTAQDYDRIKQESDIWWINHNRAKEEGKFKSVEIFNQHLTAFGLAVNRALNESEKGLKKTILEEIEKLGNGSVEPSSTADSGASQQQRPTELIEDAIARGVRAAVDGLRASVARAVLETTEPEGLRELH